MCLKVDNNYAQALTILKIWKNRTPLLSAGVEGTLILLEALLTEKETLLDSQLTQIYAISIMRYILLFHYKYIIVDVSCFFYLYILSRVPFVLKLLIQFTNF